MIGFNFDRRTIYIIIGVLIIATLLRLGAYGILVTFLTLPGVILAISFHEFGHAFVADRLGDRTPRNQGRLTLNPSAHLDPVGIVLLLFAHIGWGKPVQINPNNFSRTSKEKGEVLVSIAGPIMNFILAILFTVVYYLIAVNSPYAIIEMLYATEITGMSFMSLVALTVYYAIIVNIGLGVFNLIPIPPLDGSKIFLRLLPYKAKYWLQEHETTIYLVFLLLWITGILSILVSPVINLIRSGIFNLIESIFLIFI